MVRTGGSSRPKTRQSSVNKLVDLVGCGKEFVLSDIPTHRAVIQRAILIKEKLYVQNDTAKTEIKKADIIPELATLIIEQWKSSNDKFVSPVTIQKGSLEKRLDRYWTKVESVTS